MKGVEKIDPRKKTIDIDSPEFLERLRSYDEAAFHHLMQEYRARIYNLALRLTRNPDDAEEVLQEAFLSVFDKIHTFQGKSRLSTWIYAIASNAALSKIRKNSVQTVTFDDEDSLNIDAAIFRNRNVVFEPKTDDALLTRELQEKLDQAIDSLPEGYREMFIMKEIEKMPVKEIADIFGINPGAVKTRLHRARLFLRAKLSDYWIGEEKQ